jgi:hypothetical protein
MVTRKVHKSDFAEERGRKDLHGAKRSKKARNKNRQASIQITIAQIQ